MALVVFGLALVLRLAFVLWAPAQPTGDGLYYHMYAIDLLHGNGYVNFDRSPANIWMPGWPAFLAAWYSVVGPEPRAAMLVNALLGAATAGLVTVLGGLLFTARAGRWAGLLYAIWPGLIYYSATLFNETLFSFLLACLLLLLVRAARAEERRVQWSAATGVAFAACAWVKAEPLVFAPALCLFLFTQRRSNADFARCAAVLLLVTAALIAPWTYRNYRTFDRFIPTAAGGGSAVAAANHSGAKGGNAFRFLVRYVRELGVEDASQAEQTLAMNDDGWRRARAFVREHPREAVKLMGLKLMNTYGNDAAGATLVRGYQRASWHLDEATWLTLGRIANLWWAAMVSLVFIGFLRIGSWPGPTRVLVLSLLGTWLGLHLVFLGGARFHHPELLIHAMIAGVGADALRQLSRRARFGAP